LSRAKVAEPSVKLLSWPRVTEPCVKLLSWPRVTEVRVELPSRPWVTELRVEFVSPFFGYKRILVHEFARPHKFAEVLKVTWNVRQRIKPGSILPSDPKTSSEALQELSKTSAF